MEQLLLLNEVEELSPEALQSINDFLVKNGIVVFMLHVIFEKNINP